MKRLFLFIIYVVALALVFLGNGSSVHAQFVGGCTIQNNNGTSTFYQNTSGSFSTTPTGIAAVAALAYGAPSGSVTVACTNPQIFPWSSCPGWISFTELGTYIIACSAYNSSGGTICTGGTGGCGAIAVSVIPAPTLTPTITPTPTPIPPRTISGVVFTDTNGNGLQEPPGEGCYADSTGTIKVFAFGTSTPLVASTPITCPGYSMTVPGNKKYSVQITFSSTSNYGQTGWNNGLSAVTGATSACVSFIPTNPC